MDFESIPSGVRMHWGPVLSRCDKRATLKENLLNIPSSSFTLTDEWNIDREKFRVRIRNRLSHEYTKMLWETPQPDGIYYFNRKYVVCPDNTVLQFD